MGWYVPVLCLDQNDYDASHGRCGQAVVVGDTLLTPLDRHIEKTHLFCVSFECLCVVCVYQVHLILIQWRDCIFVIRSEMTLNKGLFKCRFIIFGHSTGSIVCCLGAGCPCAVCPNAVRQNPGYGWTRTFPYKGLYIDYINFNFFDFLIFWFFVFFDFLIFWFFDFLI